MFDLETLMQNRVSRRGFLQRAQDWFKCISRVCLSLAGVVAAGELHAGDSVDSLLEIRQRHVVLQQWDLSCGAAVLATLLQHQHGMSVTEREIAVQLAGREEYVQNPELLRIRQGFSLLDLKRYVESRELVGTGMGQLSLDDLLQLVPVIVPISAMGYNHFVVFRGMAGNRVLLADPAWGNRTMLVDEFVDNWLAFPQIGRVGFTVTHNGPPSEFNSLSPSALDFVMLK